MLRFLIVMLMCVLAGAEVDLFVPSFPDLQRQFALTPFWVELSLGANFAAYCLGSLVAGSLGDRYGRRPIILLGLGVFALGSVMCVLAPSYPWLLAGRFLQGLGIAGPATLAYVVFADAYPIAEQQRLLGVVHGVTTAAMALAPVVGSQVNLQWGWRGNFVVLLGLGLVCLAGALLLPRRTAPPAAAIPVRYGQLLRSGQVWLLALAICFLVIPYWIFIGMAPLLYVRELGVSLERFGYYQGATAATFAIVSLSSPWLLRRLGATACFYGGCALCLTSGLALLTLAVCGARNPLLITASVLPSSAGVVFPVNVLYPLALDAVDNARSRLAAIVLALRLVTTALGLQLAGYVYDGGIERIAIIMVACLSLGFLTLTLLVGQQRLQLDVAPAAMAH